MPLPVAPLIDGESPDPGLLARNIKAALQLKRKQDGTLYTHEEVAEQVSKMHLDDQVEETRSTTKGTQDEVDNAVDELRRNHRPLMHRTYLGRLLSGQQDNPTRNVMVYLARFLGVDPGALISDGEAATVLEAELAKLQGMREDLEVLRTLKESGQMPEILALARSTGPLSPVAASGVLRLALMAAQQAREIADDAVSGGS
jgi:transcriptional regulator with XRE-family HTH domain